MQELYIIALFIDSDYCVFYKVLRINSQKISGCFSAGKLATDATNNKTFV